MKVVKAKKKGSGPKKGVTIAIVVVIVLLALATIFVNFLTDWMWFVEMGYVSVFFKQLFTELKLGIPFFLVIWFCSDFYLNRLKKKYFSEIVSNEATDQRRLTRYTRLVSALFSLLFTIVAVQRLWFRLLKFMNSTDFNIKDPVFHNDISFYIFKLDFLEQLNDLLLIAVILLIILTAVYYGILVKMHSPQFFEKDYTQRPESGPSAGSRSMFEGLFERFAGEAEKSGRVRVDRSNLHAASDILSGHAIVLGVIFFLMLGLEFFFRQYELLHSHTGIVYGAGYTDIHVRLLVLRVLMVLSLVGAVLFVVYVRKRTYKKILRIPVVMIIVAVVGTGIGLVVQNPIVSSDELNKEYKYLERNIKYTRYAYGLNDVDVEPFAANNDLTAEDIKDNSETLTNIRINDYDPVKTYYNQTQSIRQYYTFNDVDIDRYTLNGRITQTYLAPREIDESKISDTWLNRHLKYTHGYGIALSRVNEVTASGQPDILVKNIPPESSVEEIKITQPRIYFGESTNDYALVDTKEDEFDYPDGTKNKYTKYEGRAGIRLNPFARFLFAVREHSLKLLISTNVTSDSRILIYRNIGQRVRRIFPYLQYDNDPYAVTDGGKIYWIIDAYTTSSKYPYSEPYSDETGSTNYIRNSVKVVIDAYNGDVTFYVVDEDEPIAKTYQKMFPKLFRDFDEMPDGLKAHIRYPDDMFSIQADIYSRYHMKNVRVFYQDEDRWDVANEIYGTKQRRMSPTYYIVKLPGEDSAEFINSVPFTPKSKQNMTGLMVARNDGEHYGKITVYQFPKSKTVYGPMQIEAQIDQNTQISQDFSLWSSSGSTYRRGNLFTIPLKDSLLYVEPVYLEASNSAIPEVKRVIVAYNDRISYKPTLSEALDSLFGDDGGTESTQKNSSGEGTKKTTSDYIKGAQDAYDNAQQALKDGDWAAYGKYMNELKENLDALNE